MAEFLKERGIRNYKDVKELELEGYISYMEREKFASSSISRSVASMRAFFQYLWKEGVIAEDPADNLKPPKVEKRAPEILTIEEVDKLLQQPKLDTPKGIRDSAMLELLYATGMRVSEMLHLQILMSISSLDMWSVMRMEKRGLSLLVFHARRQWNGICKQPELFL